MDELPGAPPTYDEAVAGIAVSHQIRAEDYDEPDSGPREDQYKAFGWFESQGWKKKWALHYAAMKGDVVAIIRLVTKENIPADQKMTDWYDSEPVGWAASFGQLGALRCLIDLGAYPFTLNKAGYTALTDAQRERHQKCIEYLQSITKDSTDSPSSNLKALTESVTTKEGGQ